MRRTSLARALTSVNTHVLDHHQRTFPDCLIEPATCLIPSHNQSTSGSAHTNTFPFFFNDLHPATDESSWLARPLLYVYRALKKTPHHQPQPDEPFKEI
ncbi:MAG: hypothetical protein V7606_1894 [Burkholderiales bacterium]